MTRQLAIRKAHAAVPAGTDVWNSFRRQVDELSNDFSDGFQSLAPHPFSRLEQSRLKESDFAALAVDVVENGKSYVITAELPGVHEKNMDVTISNGNLVIKGDKHQEKMEKSENYYLSERSYGSFQRMFGLPAGIDESKIEAQFHNGVLTVTVPKSAEAPGARKVDVKAA